MKTRNEIERLVQNRLEQEEGAVFTYVFGPFAESEAFRDIDLGLYLKQEVYNDLQNRDVRLAVELEQTLGIPVDVVPLNGAPDHLVHQISRGKVLVDRDPEFRYDFITLAWKRHFDFQPKRRAYLAEFEGLCGIVGKVISLLGEANKALGLLEDYRCQDSSALVDNAERMRALKYQFIVLLEACIDLCNHVSARSLSQAPESYGQCFELLGKQQVITGVLSQKMSELARFRNVLVHLYWKVDDRRVVELLNNELGSVREYLTVIAGLAQRSG